MSDPDDLMARGRAIFERLRTAEIERRETDPPPGPAQADETDGPSDEASDDGGDTLTVDTGPADATVSDVTFSPPAPQPAEEDHGFGDGHPAAPEGLSTPDGREVEDHPASARAGGADSPMPPFTQPDAAAPPGEAGAATASAGEASIPDRPWPEPVAAASSGVEAPHARPADQGVHPEPALERVPADEASKTDDAPEERRAEGPDSAPEDVGASVEAPERPPTPVPHADPVAAPPELDELLEETGVEDRGARPIGASPFARDLPRILAIANQKGGVGKTTTAVNLGACLADLGYRVLVIDLDPQGNASTGLGINIRALQASMYDVIINDFPLEDCVEATTVRNLFVAPASLDLAGAEIELVPAFSRELKLRRALEDVVDDYDFVLVDCPPSLGLLTVNGLAAAGEVLVPIQCEYYALEGLGQLLRNVNLVQKNLNSRLELSAIVLVMYDARTKLADQVVREVRSHFGDKVCRNIIPRTVRLSEAPSFGQPIIAFDSSSRGAIAYRELAKEVSGGTPQRAR